MRQLLRTTVPSPVATFCRPTCTFPRRSRHPSPRYGHHTDSVLLGILSQLLQAAGQHVYGGGGSRKFHPAEPSQLLITFSPRSRQLSLLKADSIPRTLSLSPCRLASTQSPRLPSSSRARTWWCLVPDRSDFSLLPQQKVSVLPASSPSVRLGVFDPSPRMVEGEVQMLTLPARRHSGESLAVRQGERPDPRLLCPVEAARRRGQGRLPAKKREPT